MSRLILLLSFVFIAVIALLVAGSYFLVRIFFITLMGILFFFIALFMYRRSTAQVRPKMRNGYM